MLRTLKCILQIVGKSLKMCLLRHSLGYIFITCPEVWPTFPQSWVVSDLPRSATQTYESWPAYGSSMVLWMKTDSVWHLCFCCHPSGGAGFRSNTWIAGQPPWSDKEQSLVWILKLPLILFYMYAIFYLSETHAKVQECQLEAHYWTQSSKTQGYVRLWTNPQHPHLA